MSLKKRSFQNIFIPKHHFSYLKGSGSSSIHLGVSKNRGKTTKMDGVYKGNPIRIDDLGVPLFLETPIWLVKSSKTQPQVQNLSYEIYQQNSLSRHCRSDLMQKIMSGRDFSRWQSYVQFFKVLQIEVNLLKHMFEPTTPSGILE